MSAEAYLVLMALLFTVDALEFLLCHNAIIAFMSVELMLNAANLVFVTFARQRGKLDDQVASFFAMVMATVEVMVGLAIIIVAYRTRCSASASDVNLLKL